MSNTLIFIYFIKFDMFDWHVSVIIRKPNRFFVGNESSVLFFI